MQEARGTTVGDRSEGSSPGRFIASPRSWLLFAVVALVLLVVDQVTKVLAVRHLTDRDDIELVGELLQLHLTYNPGAAFSLGTGFTEVLSALAVAATVVVLWISRRAASKVWALGLGLLLAGIVGNLLDRIFRDPGPFRGHVVDFLMLPNWPVFNVADMCINVGVAVVLLQVLRGVALDGTRVPADAPDDKADQDGEENP
ncbi:signal peptidase II [Nocardioides sp. zg-536]|uniref:Lipoprotein signal peptidase n=1 Tax=Nocardioides faecalis TaxID=2803858 RepID=A0A938Y744_9ACTN|nr:signal peptidase II [Nocardioides faecalis]MBM9460490.1 signal peptidase II [Nocardioides faecalis]MBS4752265.1 signal peptidase II [Nocardioides faecalis]QVI57573.1 signal peptidase II [Nocardioides faecalis]